MSQKILFVVFTKLISLKILQAISVGNLAIFLTCITSKENNAFQALTEIEVHNLIFT